MKPRKITILAELSIHDFRPTFDSMENHCSFYTWIPALESIFLAFLEPNEWERTLGSVENELSLGLKDFCLADGLFALLGPSCFVPASGQHWEDFAESFSQTEQNMGGGGNVSIISAATETEKKYKRHKNETHRKDLWDIKLRLSKKWFCQGFS